MKIVFKAETTDLKLAARLQGVCERANMPFTVSLKSEDKPVTKRGLYKKRKAISSKGGRRKKLGKATVQDIEAALSNHPNATNAGVAKIFGVGQNVVWRISHGNHVNSTPGFSRAR